MGTEENGLSLQGMAQELEALTERLAGLETENAGLRHELAALRGSAGDAAAEEPTLGFEGRVSRRALLTKAAPAAVAVAAGAMLNAREAKANHYDTGIEVEWVHTHTVIASAQFTDTAIHAGNTSSNSGALRARNSGDGPGVRALGGTGVWGSSDLTGFSGVYGQHTGTSGYGVVGDGTGGSAGVLGRNSGGHGVRGEGQSGVVGTSSAAGFSGVSGVHTGSGYGVVGDGAGSANAGVLGRNSGGHGVRGEGQFGVVGNGAGSGNGVLGRISSLDAQAVRGEAPNGVGVGAVGARGVWGHALRTGDSGVLGEFVGSSDRGYGVTGVGKGSGAGVWGRNSGGYGGQFSGGKAQLMLMPGASAGRPTTGAHLRGELYMGSTGTLFVCTASGTPGTWRKVATTAA